MSQYLYRFKLFDLCYLIDELIDQFNELTSGCWTLDVSRTASYEINLVCQSVSLFLKIGSLVFSDIVSDDS